MKFNLSNILKLIVSLGIGAGIIYLQLHKLSPEERATIWGSICNVDLKWVIISMIIALFANIIRGLRWIMLLEPLGKKPRVGVTLAATFILYIGNLLFPRLGEVMRCAIVSKYEKIPLDQCVGTMVTERIIDVIGISALCSFALIFEMDVILQFIDSFYKGFNISTSLIIYAGIGLILFGLLVFFILKKLNFIEKINNLLKGFKEGFATVFQLEKSWLFILYSAIIYVCYWFAVVVCFFAFKEVETLHATAGLTLLFASSIGVMIAQGGLGATQYLTQKTLLLYHIPENIGIAFGWVAWSGQTVMLLIGGVAAMIYLFFVKNDNNSDTVENI
jgi:glycosyltransferase 2 family protein